MRISDWSSDVCSSDLIVSAAFTGTSNNFAEVMRQNTAINAFMQARNSMSGGTGAAEIDTFAQTRADIQARNTYNSIAQQAMAWVPILTIVLTVVFFAMFPAIGRASCRERGCRSCEIRVVVGALKKHIRIKN